MKDDQPFKSIAALMKQIELKNGRSSLIVSHEVEIPDAVSSNALGHILANLKLGYLKTGATHGELKNDFINSGHGSESTFNRGLKIVNKSGEVRVEGKGKGKKYFPIGVSVT